MKKRVGIILTIIIVISILFFNYKSYKNNTPLESVIINSKNTSYCYLYFTITEYIINYNTNGGTLSNTTQVVGRGDAIGTLPTPTKGKDYFEGWYKESTFENKVDNTYIPTKNETLYARWYEWIDLNLSGRTEGYPSDTTLSLNTKRRYNMNTYVVGMAYDNHYSPTTIANYNISSNTISINTKSGYGIGIPIQLSAGNYVLMCYVDYIDTTTGAQISAIKHTSDGTPYSEYKSRIFKGNISHFFEVLSIHPYIALVFSGSGPNDGVSRFSYTFSNINLYKIN